MQKNSIKKINQMNKKIQLLSIAVLLALTTQAQLFKYGANVGLNLAEVKTDNFDGSSLMGFQTGIMAELKLPVLLGVQGELKFSQKGAKISSEDLVLSYIDLPIVAKFYILKVFSIQVGPQYSYMLNAKMDGADVKDSFGNHDFSAVLGLGVDIFKLHYSMRYYHGLTDVADGGGSMENQYIQFSIGYWFSKGGKD